MRKAPKRQKNPAEIRRFQPDLVGVSGFEPEASWSRTKRDTKLRHTRRRCARSLPSQSDFGTRKVNYPYLKSAGKVEVVQKVYNFGTEAAPDWEVYIELENEYDLYDYVFPLTLPRFTQPEAVPLLVIAPNIPPILLARMLAFLLIPIILPTFRQFSDLP